LSLRELEALLALQEHDTRLDQLRHRWEALPERAQLDARTAELRAQVVQRDERQKLRDQTAATERRIDDEARAVESHAADVDKKLYSGTVQSPRELQAMQADVDMLRRQLTELEDQELEVMEQRETLDAEVAALATSVAGLEATSQQLREAITAAEREIDGEIAQETSQRDAQASTIGEALLRDYEKRRTQNRGTGAARLVGVTCQACHLSIPSTEAEHIRRAEGNEVAYCDNCGAILVP
jgi:predicted  nucleic acid-binding Zn-ribbon protein